MSEEVASIRARPLPASGAPRRQQFIMRAHQSKENHYYMNARQQKILSRFGQVLTFLDANTNTVPPVTVATQRQLLNSAIAQINGFANDQVLRGNETVLAQTLSSARIALRDTYMRQLSTVGLHSLTGKQSTDPNVPRALQIFTLPATRTNASTLLQAAQAMLTAATPYASIFTTAGVSLEQVAAAIQALQAAINAENSAKRIAKGATQGIAAQIQAGQGAVRMMDVLIRPLLASNKPLLTQWESVKRAAGGSNLATPVPVPAAVSSAGSTSTSTTSAESGTSPTSAPASTSTSQSGTSSGSSATAAG